MSKLFVGAYNENGKCIGLAVYKKDWLKYIYLEDLKVYKEYRGHGIGNFCWMREENSIRKWL